jgi:hypothetical protein
VQLCYTVLYFITSRYIILYYIISYYITYIHTRAFSLYTMLNSLKIALYGPEHNTVLCLPGKNATG